MKNKFAEKNVYRGNEPFFKYFTITDFEDLSWFVCSNPYEVGQVAYTPRKTIGSNKYVPYLGCGIVRNGKTYAAKDYGFFFAETRKGREDFIVVAYAHVDNVGKFTKQQIPKHVKLGMNEKGLFVESCTFEAFDANTKHSKYAKIRELLNYCNVAVRSEYEPKRYEDEGVNQYRLLDDSLDVFEGNVQKVKIKVVRGHRERVIDLDDLYLTPNRELIYSFKRECSCKPVYQCLLIKLHNSIMYGNIYNKNRIPLTIYDYPKHLKYGKDAQFLKTEEAMQLPKLKCRYTKGGYIELYLKGNYPVYLRSIEPTDGFIFDKVAFQCFRDDFEVILPQDF